MAETVRPPSFAFEGSCSVGALLLFSLLLSGFSGADASLFLWQTVKVLPFHLPQLRRMTLRGAPVSGFCSSHPRVGDAVLRTAGHGRALGRPFSRSPFSPDGPPPPSIHPCRDRSSLLLSGPSGGDGFPFLWQTFATAASSDGVSARVSLRSFWGMLLPFFRLFVRAGVLPPLWQAAQYVRFHCFGAPGKSGQSHSNDLFVRSG